MRPKAEDPGQFYWMDRRLSYTRQHAAQGITESVRGFYPDGALMFEYPMQARYLNGTGMMFYPDGKKRKEETYHEGRLHGVVRVWDELGQLRKRAAFVRGVRHGLSLEWDAAGRFAGQELFLRGQDVPAGLNAWIAKTPIHARHVMGVKNIEIRRIFLMELGYERLLAGVEHRILHQEGEQALVRIDLPGRDEAIVLVKVKCPSTGAFYVLRVPPQMRTVREAVAWTFDLSEAAYRPVQES